MGTPLESGLESWETWLACSAAQTHVHLSPAGRSPEESPETLRTFKEFGEQRAKQDRNGQSPARG